MSLVEVGQVLKPQGIKGEVKLRHFCDSADVFTSFNELFLENSTKSKPLILENVRVDREAVYVKISGIETRDDAEALRGALLYADSQAFPALPQDSFYIRDLIGLEVETEEGKPLGKIIEVLQHGAVDVYCVKSENKAFMFPALKRVMIKTDITAGKMVLDKSALSEVAVYED